MVRVAPPNIVQQSTVDKDSSTHTFTVPDNQVWVLKTLYVKLVATATVGNRDMRVEIGDGTNLLWFKKWNPSTLQAAGTTRYYYAAPDMVNDADFDGDDRVGMEMEEHVLPAGYTIKIFDEAAIDDTTPADTLSAYLDVDAGRAPAPVPAV